MANFCAPIGSNEVIISDQNFHEFLGQEVDGEKKARGLIPRNFVSNPVGYLACAKPFDIDLIPESEWEDRLEEQVKQKAQLSDIRERGRNGDRIPSTDQNGKGYCATADTEILTDGGWVAYPEYNWSDPVGTMNPVNGRLEFQVPYKRHVYEYDGEMIYSTNRRIDFGVTPDHRMLVRKWDERKRTLSDEFTFQRAEDLGWYVGLPHSTTGWLGTSLDVLGVDEDRHYDGSDFLALVALVVSDGYAGGSESTRNWVSFSCFREDRYAMVAALAKRVGFEETPSRKGVWTRYDAAALAEWFRFSCYTGSSYRSQSKQVPDIVKVATGKQIEHFLKFFGDQNHGKDSQPTFYSTSKKMVDDLQELHLRIGKRSTISDRGPRRAVMEDGKVIESGSSHVLTVSTTDRLCLDRKKHIEKDRYKGLVYCASVPNGTLVTRRNGSVLISGNCWAHSSTSAALLTRAVNNQPFADLSAYAVACIIKKFRDEGGWGSESLEFIAERGIPTSEFWPQRSMSRSNDNDKTWANAALHKFSEWRDMDPGSSMKKQIVTCLLLNLPVVSDFNWWGHSVCSMDLVSITPFRTRILNSWGDVWSENGSGILEGSKAIPNGALCACVMTASDEMKNGLASINTDRLRLRLLAMVDDALSHTILVRGEHRNMLEALARYTADMSEEDLNRFQGCIRSVVSTLTIG